MYCGNCGQLLKEGDKFCGRCGAKVKTNEPLKCNQCGALIETGMLFCSQCGTRAGTPAVRENAEMIGNNSDTNADVMHCLSCNAELKPFMEYCPVCGMYTGASDGDHFEDNANVYMQPAEKTEHPMAWYKFLSNFGVYAGAVFNILVAIATMTGGKLGPAKYLVYRKFPDLRIVDIIAGMFLLGIAAFGISVGISLRRKYRSAPRMLYSLYALSAVWSLLYSVSTALATDSSIGDVLYFYEGYMQYTVTLGNDSTLVLSIVTSVVIIILNAIYFNKRKELFVN